MAKIFISYSHRNKELARLFFGLLKDKNNEVFIDSSFLKLGSRFSKDISKQIKISDGFVALLTKEAISSDYVIGEIGSARLLFDDDLILIIALISPGIDPPSMVKGLLHDELKEDNHLELAGKIHEAVNEFLVKKEALINSLNTTTISSRLSDILRVSANRYHNYRVICGSVIGLILPVLMVLSQFVTIPVPLYLYSFITSAILGFIFTRLSTCLKFCQLAEIVCLKDVPQAVTIIKQSPCMNIDPAYLLRTKNK